MPDVAPIGLDYQEIWNRVNDGSIVPFLGAGASAYVGMPAATSLAASLVAAGEFPEFADNQDLALVAAYVLQKKDTITLNRAVRRALTPPPRPGALHSLLAACSNIRLYVTTNYDELLESALASRRPWVVVDRGEPGKVSCRNPDGAWRDSKRDSLRTLIKNSSNPIVLKLHGSVAPAPTDDRFLITEDQYVEFLGRPADKQIPSMLVDHMKSRSFLFLGYALRDWNVRVLLRKLQEARGGQKITSWGIVLHTSEVERALWRRRDVELRDLDLATFTSQFEAARPVCHGTI